jgi:hypothetical protein
MICALWGRRISRRKVAARQYVYSRHSRNYYCGPGEWQRCSRLRRRRAREAPAA